MDKTMGKTVTFGHILAIISILVLPLIGWGVSVEKRFTKEEENTKINELRISNLEDEMKKSNEVAAYRHKEVIQSLHRIELKVENKKDRE